MLTLHATPIKRRQRRFIPTHSENYFDEKDCTIPLEKDDLIKNIDALLQACHAVFRKLVSVTIETNRESEPQQITYFREGTSWLANITIYAINPATGVLWVDKWSLYSSLYATWRDHSQPMSPSNWKHTYWGKTDRAIQGWRVTMARNKASRARTHDRTRLIKQELLAATRMPWQIT